MLNNKLRLVRILVASFIGLLLLSYLLLLLPIVQEKIGRQIAHSMSQSLGTEVKLEGLSFSLLNRVDLKNILIRDQQKDTLLFAKTLKLRVSDVLFSSKEPVIRYIGLEKASIYLHRKTPVWNYQFIVDHLMSNDTSKASTQSIDLKKVDLTNIKFVQDDEWIGSTTKLEAKHLLANFNRFESKTIEIEKLILDKPFYYLLDKPGLAPPQRKKQFVPKTNSILIVVICKFLQNKLKWYKEKFG